MSLAALAATASLGAVAVTGLAGSASATTLKIKCATLSGTLSTTATVSGCSGNTGGASQPIAITSLLGGGTITWVNGKTTTISAPTISSGTLCPVGDTDDIAKGTVSADTTHSVTVGSAYKIEVCLDGNDNLSFPAHKANGKPYKGKI
jgi:hypothetical protein